MAFSFLIACSMSKIWPFIHSDAFEKEERLFFIFSGFLNKDDFIGFTRRRDSFDGHSMVVSRGQTFFFLSLVWPRETNSMVSKMVIEFFL